MNIGDTFHQLTVIGFGSTRKGQVNVRCTCGNELVVAAYALRRGNNKSCGCRKVAATKAVMKKHGEILRVGGKRTPTAEYRAWQLMKNRCLNPKSRDYPYYGGRGISIHPSWVNSVEQFIADVGRRPSPDMTLDRVDVNGNYEPNNCRWATRKTQARNRAYAKVKAWILAERLGVRQTTVHHMIWQVRRKDKGVTEWFALSPELEQTVRNFLKEAEQWQE